MPGLGTITVGGIPGSGANLEDLQEVITMISPDEATLLASIGRVQAKDTTHGWLTDALAAVSSAAAAEGADFSSPTLTGRTRHQTFTQIFTLHVQVSNSQRAVNPAGVDDEYKYQIMKRAREIVRNMDYRAFGVSGNAQSATSDTGRRVMKTLQDLITANQAMRSQAIDGVGHASSATCATILTERRINNALQIVWDAGATVDLVICQAAPKRQIAKISGGSDKRRTIESTSKLVVTGVELYDSPVGVIEVMLERSIQMPTGHTQAVRASMYGITYFIERDMAAWATLRPVKHVPLPPTGDSTRGTVIGESALEYGHPAAGLRVWGTWNVGIE